MKAVSGSKVPKSRSQSLTASKPSITASTTGEISELSVTPVCTENKEVLINPDCYLGSILDYICEVTGLPRYGKYKKCYKVNTNEGVSILPQIVKQHLL